MKKEYRVCMDGPAWVWADNEDDARNQIRESFNMYHYAEETGETMEDPDDVESNETQLFSTRNTDLDGWKEAVDRLTKLLRDRKCKLSGKEAPRKQVAGLDY